MRPSRRRLLGAIGTSAITLAAGCTGVVRSRTAASDPALQVQLQGTGTDTRLFESSGVARVGPVRETRSGTYAVTVTLNDATASDVTGVFRTEGVAKNADDFEVVVVADGDEIDRFRCSQGFAREIAERDDEGAWNGRFRLVFSKRSDAEQVQTALASDGSITEGSPTATGKTGG